MRGSVLFVTQHLCVDFLFFLLMFFLLLSLFFVVTFLLNWPRAAAGLFFFLTPLLGFLESFLPFLQCFLR